MFIKEGELTHPSQSLLHSEVSFRVMALQITNNATQLMLTTKYTWKLHITGNLLL